MDTSSTENALARFHAGGADTEATSRKLEGMHHQLLSHLQAKRASPMVIASWEEAWKEAIADPGELMPCPECFLEHKLFRLEPFGSYGDIDQVRCGHCRTVFMYFRA